MRNVEQRDDPERQQAILHTNERWRQLEQLQEKLQAEGLGESHEDNPAHDELIDRAAELLEELRAGDITQEQFLEQIAPINSHLEEYVEAEVEVLGEAGHIEPVMTRRAEKEAEMKSMSGFLQALVGDAFAWASRGTLEADWLIRVFDK